MSEQSYDREEVLQELLAKHPELLPGEALNPNDFTGMRARAVHNAYALEPGGKSLGEVALEQGLWAEQ